MGRLFWAAMCIALISMVFANCKKDEPTYMVQVIATEGGTVEGQNGEYQEGDTVVFMAVPADGYFFSQWSDGNTENPRTVTINNAEITITAQFAINPLLTISTSDNGTIESEVNGRYAPGSSVTITAKPADGCNFMSWDDGNTDNPRTITIGNEDISLAALFLAPTVDLGLPSGTIWATCNVGAANPWDYGDYYAWGETETKDDYSWETYKYCNGTRQSFTKYNLEWYYGSVIDNKKTLVPTDDVATVVFGAEYSIPKEDDWEELLNECYWVWTTDYNSQSVSGIIVYRAKSKGDKGTKIIEGDTPSVSYTLSDVHIFLPAGGSGVSSNLVLAAGEIGNYWSASLNPNNSPSALSLQFYTNKSFVTSRMVTTDRYEGISVRSVKRP